MTSFVAGRGSPVSGLTVSGGESGTVLSGGIAIDITVLADGQINLSGGGQDSGTVLRGGGETVASGGVSDFAVVSSGGAQIVFGKSDFATLSGGGSQSVSAGGSAIATTVASGGVETVFAGGETDLTVVAAFGGYQYVSSGGIASNTALSGAGQDFVFSGGSAISTTMATDGYDSEVVFSGGSATGTNLGVGNVQYVQYGGVATSSLVGTTSLEYVDGLAVYAQVSSGGQQVVSSGGTAEQTSVLSGGTEMVQVGGTVTDLSVHIGGTIDLVGFAYSSGATAPLNSSTDVLTVSAGGSTLALQLADLPSGETFVVAPDSGTGTLLTAVQASSPRTLVWTGGGSSTFSDPKNWDDTTNGDNPALYPETQNDTVEFGSGGGALSGTGAAAALLFETGAWGLGAGSSISTTGTLAVGITGFTALSLTAGAAVNTQANAVIASAANASGSSINVVGAAAKLGVTGTLLVGQVGFGSLNISQAGTVSGAAATLGANAGSDGVISVQGSLSVLNLAGSLAVGGAATGELDILGGAKVTAANIAIGGGGSASTGNVDIEGSGSELIITGASLDVGATGNGGAVLTVGVGSTLAFNGAVVEGGKASINNYGGVIDPATVTYSGSSNSLTGVLLVQQYIDTAGGNTAGSGISIIDGTGTVTTPMILFGTSVADAQINIGNGTGSGVWTIGEAGTLIVNANTVDAGQLFDFSTGDTDSALVIGQVVDGFVAGGNPDTGVIGVEPTIAAGAENLLAAGGFSGTIQNYQSGDLILLNGAAATAYSVGAGGVLSLSFAGGGQATLDFVTATGRAASSSILAEAGQQIVNSSAVACYVRGTRMRTDCGEVAIEDLSIGDNLVTISGAIRPIKWVGRRCYNAPFLQRNAGVWPIMIRRGAIADNVPRRDLFVSPCHALYLDDILIPARTLLNGMTIVRVSDWQEVAYFHIELDTHDIVFAEGVAAESYIDLENRHMFQNSADYAARYPDDLVLETNEIAVRCEHGAAVDAVRQRLITRAVGEDYRPPVTYTITLVEIGVTRHVLPPGVSELHFVSAVGYAPGDRRPLGALLPSLSIDGEGVDLGDLHLTRGFHPVEQHGDRAVCWTNGAGVMKLTPLDRARLVDVEVAAVMPVLQAS